MIRVVLVDDHALVRTGLETILNDHPDIKVVAVGDNGFDAVDLAQRFRPDVILMDLSMPEMDGIEATRIIHETHPQCRIVILTAHAEQDRILDAIDAGAIGYLLKDADPEDIVRGLRSAAEGSSPIDPRAATAMIRSRRPSPITQLTARELEVLELVGDGLANKQISRKLGIAEKTVKAHLTKVFAALGVSDRTQAALWLNNHEQSTHWQRAAGS